MLQQITVEVEILLISFFLPVTNICHTPTRKYPPQVSWKSTWLRSSQCSSTSTYPSQHHLEVASFLLIGAHLLRSCHQHLSSTTKNFKETLRLGFFSLNEVYHLLSSRCSNHTHEATIYKSGFTVFRAHTSYPNFAPIASQDNNHFAHYERMCMLLDS